MKLDGLEKKLDGEHGVIHLSFDDSDKWCTFGDLIEVRMEEVLRQKLEALSLNDEGGSEYWWTVQKRILSMSADGGKTGT